MARLTASEARSILHETHSAWSEGDFDGTLACYNDDLRYVCDTGGINGAPLVIAGKNQFRDFLLPVMENVDSSSTIHHFQFDGQIGRAFIGCHLRNRTTGLDLLGTYTQVVKFRRGKIFRLFEIHDVARMAAFWRLVLSEEEEPSATIKVYLDNRRGGATWREQLPSAFKARPNS